MLTAPEILWVFQCAGVGPGHQCFLETLWVILLCSPDCKRWCRVSRVRKNYLSLGFMSSQTSQHRMPFSAAKWVDSLACSFHFYIL